MLRGDDGQSEVRLIFDAFCVALDLGAWNSTESRVLSNLITEAVTESISWENVSRLAIT